MFSKEFWYPVLLFLLVSFGLPNLHKILPIGDVETHTVAQPGRGVLMIRDASIEAERQLTPEVLAILDGKAPGSFRDYCKQNTPNGLFVLHDTDDVSLMPKWVQEIWTKKRESLPAFYAMDGKHCYNGPFPKTTEEAINIAKKYEVSK